RTAIREIVVRSLVPAGETDGDALNRGILQGGSNRINEVRSPIGGQRPGLIAEGDEPARREDRANRVARTRVSEATDRPDPTLLGVFADEHGDRGPGGEGGRELDVLGVLAALVDP